MCFEFMGGVSEIRRFEGLYPHCAFAPSQQKINVFLPHKAYISYEVFYSYL